MQIVFHELTKTAKRTQRRRPAWAITSQGDCDVYMTNFLNVFHRLLMGEYLESYNFKQCTFQLKKDDKYNNIGQ